MATASVNRAMLWTDLEGQVLPGGWRLNRLARPEGRNAWYEAQGPDGKPAMVSLTEALNDEDELLARLRAASAIRHPNVVAIREARLMMAEDTPMVMAVMEPTDENLADVLRERTLDAAEARAVLDALLKGLAAIHAQRLTHGRMETASVVAMGDTVKLRSDCLHLEGFERRAAEDVAGAGRIVVQAMTRRIPASEHDAALQLLPEPLGQAVRRALSGQATVEEVAALAGVRMPGRQDFQRAENANAVLAKVTAMPAQRIAATKTQESPALKTDAPRPQAAKEEQRTPAKPGFITGQMDLPLRPRRSQDSEADNDDELTGWKWPEKWRLPEKWQWPEKWRLEYHRESAPYWIAAAGLLVAVTVWVLLGWIGQQHAVKTPSAASPAAAAQPTAIVKHKAAAAVVRGSSAPARVQGQGIWRVVVDTYGDRAHAAARARTLSAKYPQLRFGVMATRGGDYLVTVGGQMTRDQAIAARARAVRMGLPRDAYAQNFR